MKQIIHLADNTLVEIDGTKVKHLNADGSILYDSTRRILCDEERIEHITRNMDSKTKSMLEKLAPYLAEDIED